MTYLLSLLAASAALAQSDVAVRFPCKSGESIRLEMTRVREDSNRPERNGRSKTPLEIKVLEKTEQGCVVSWKWGLSELERGTEGPEKAVLDLAAKLAEKLVLEIRLDADGAYQGLRNEAAVAREASDLVDGIIAAQRKGQDEAQWKQTEAMIRQVLTPANQVAMMTRDAQTYFGWYGAEFKPGESVEIPLEQPFPLGGGAVKVKLQAKLEQADVAKGVIVSKTLYDADSLRERTLAFFTKSLPQATAEQLKSMPSLDMADDGRFTFNRTTGWMDEAIVHRNMSLADKMRRGDTWEFRKR